MFPTTGLVNIGSRPQEGGSHTEDTTRPPHAGNIRYCNSNQNKQYDMFCNMACIARIPGVWLPFWFYKLVRTYSGIDQYIVDVALFSTSVHRTDEVNEMWIQRCEILHIFAHHNMIMVVFYRCLSTACVQESPNTLWGGSNFKTTTTLGDLRSRIRN